MDIPIGGGNNPTGITPPTTTKKTSEIGATGTSANVVNSTSTTAGNIASGAASVAGQIPASEKLSIGDIVDLNSTDFFPGFDSKPIDFDNLGLDQMVYVHLSDYFPEGGIVKTVYDVTKESRTTTHWSMNHPVKGHGAGDWSEKKVGIFILGDEMIRKNGNPFSAAPVDSYWGSCDIDSSKCVVVIEDDSVRERQAKVLDPKECGIKEDADILLLGISGSPHAIGNKIIEKMGRTVVEGGPTILDPNVDPNFPYTCKSVDEKSLAKENSVRSFFAQRGVKSYSHAHSPHGILEQVLVKMDSLKSDNSWQVNDVDYKTAMLEHLLIAEEMGTSEIPVDVVRISDVIKNSDTPREALEQIETELNIIPEQGCDFIGWGDLAEDSPGNKKCRLANSNMTNAEVVTQQNIGDIADAFIDSGKEQLASELNEISPGDISDMVDVSIIVTDMAALDVLHPSIYNDEYEMDGAFREFIQKKYEVDPDELVNQVRKSKDMLKGKYPSRVNEFFPILNRCEAEVVSKCRDFKSQYDQCGGAYFMEFDPDNFQMDGTFEQIARVMCKTEPGEVFDVMCKTAELLKPHPQQYEKMFPLPAWKKS